MMHRNTINGILPGQPLSGGRQHYQPQEVYAQIYKPMIEESSFLSFGSESQPPESNNPKASRKAPGYNSNMHIENLEE